MLADIHGKPLIQHSFEHAKKISLLDALVIATDSEEIASVARSFGADVVMTSENHPTGSDRVGEAIEKFEAFSPDIVVNLWGDEPLTPLASIGDAITLLLSSPEAVATTIAGPIADPAEVDMESVVKLVFDKHQRVMYISRAGVPYMYNKSVPVAHYSILGALVCRTDYFKRFLKLERTPLELVEGVEQLRIIENGDILKVVVAKETARGVNTFEDLQVVRDVLGSKLA